MQIGDPCWRCSDGVAVLELPFRVVLPDGTTRTNPEEWSQEPAVLAATGWARSTLTADDVATLTPQPPSPSPSWQTPAGWSLGMTPGEASRLTGLYVFALRRSQLGLGDTVAVLDTAGERHEMPFVEFEALMLRYGEAAEASRATT